VAVTGRDLVRGARIGAAALAGTCAVAGSAYALVSTLPAPQPDDRLGVRILDRLEHSRGTGAVVDLGGRRVHVRCRKLPPYRRLLTYADGTRLALSGTHVHRLPSPGRQLETARSRYPDLIAAQADLAGSYSLYSILLAQRLAHGRTIVAGLTRVRGLPAYRIHLGQDRPEVQLIVDRRTLRPLAATYRSATLSGRSILGAPVGRNRWAAC